MYGQLPLLLLSKPIDHRRTAVKQKLQAILQNLNGSFSNAAKVNQINLSHDKEPITSFILTAKDDLVH